jgi:hypothetical protein
MRRPILSAQADVDVTVEQARDWFLSLREHPERYQFDTHEGFQFVDGDFGEIGAWFKTREQFLFFKLELLFELTEVQESAFWFRLIRPVSMGIWGRFDIAGGGENGTRLSLDIGSDTRAGQLMLRCYPMAVLVHRQIHREVGHIRRSMERTFHG